MHSVNPDDESNDTSQEKDFRFERLRQELGIGAHDSSAAEPDEEVDPRFERLRQSILEAENERLKSVDLDSPTEEKSSSPLRILIIAGGSIALVLLMAILSSTSEPNIERENSTNEQSPIEGSTSWIERYDQNEFEQGIANQIYDRYGINASNVSCPGSVSPSGSTAGGQVVTYNFTCKVSGSDGRTYTARVSWDGAYLWDWGM